MSGLPRRGTSDGLLTGPQDPADEPDDSVIDAAVASAPVLRPASRPPPPGCATTAATRHTSATHRSPPCPRSSSPPVARTEFGKGAARRIRRAHQIPAVLYGHGAAPRARHAARPRDDARPQAPQRAADHRARGRRAAGHRQGRPARPGQERHRARRPARRPQGEKITVDVDVHVVGESAPGTIHLVETQAVTLEAEATHLPETIEVDIEGLEAGAAVRAADLVLPDGATLLGRPRGGRRHDRAAAGRGVRDRGGAEDGAAAEETTEA